MVSYQWSVASANGERESAPFFMCGGSLLSVVSTNRPFSNLAGVFRIGLANRNVRIFGRIWGFVNRERLWFRRHA